MYCSLISTVLGDSVALVISPTIVIDQQMQQQMTAWGVKFLHLASVDPDSLADNIRRIKPRILLSSIERLQDTAVLNALLTVRLVYVAVDETQVPS